MIYGLHEAWPIADCLRLAHSAAAASMRAVSTTEGVVPVAECLALAEKWGLRPLSTTDYFTVTPCALSIYSRGTISAASDTDISGFASHT